MIEREIIQTESQHEEYINGRLIFNEEFLQIIDIMKNCDNYRILILGVPGSGKSTLLHQISQYTTSEKFIEIEYGHNIRGNDFRFLEINNNPIFIDGLDEVKNPYNLLPFINGKMNVNLVCTSRYIIPVDMHFTHIITIKPLTMYQVDKLINILVLNNHLLNNDLLRSFMSSQFKYDKAIIPKNILSFVLIAYSNSNVDEFYSKYKNFYINMEMVLILALILFCQIET